jgi:hypothetical protein
MSVLLQHCLLSSMRYVAFNGKMNFKGEYKIMWMEEVVFDLTSDYFTRICL